MSQPQMQVVTPQELQSVRAMIVRNERKMSYALGKLIEFLASKTEIRSLESGEQVTPQEILHHVNTALFTTYELRGNVDYREFNVQDAPEVTGEVPEVR